MVYYLAQFGGGLSSLLNNLVNLEFFQLLFPFLLGLAIFYAVLKVALKDKLQNSAIALISIILGFFVMLYFAWNPILYTALVAMSGTILMITSALLFLIIILAFVGIKLDDLIKNDISKAIITIIIIFIVIVVVFGNIPGIGLPFIISSSDFWTIIFFIAIVAIVLYYLGKEGNKKGSTPSQTSSQ